MRHVFETMGTVASLELPATDGAASLLGRVESIFAESDARFSLYRPDSELSRIAAGQLTLMDASEVMRAAYGEALRWRESTAGAFTPNRPDGVTDLNGIVKANAIEAAGAQLDRDGCTDWSLNVGGDILVRGSQPDRTPWSIGVVDPANRSELLCAIPLTGGKRAVATSGSTERGDHIWLGSSRAPAPFRQVTVVAEDIVTADVLATAIMAGGRSELDAASDRWDIDVLTVGRSNEILVTPRLRAAIER
ncbi:MAG: FAD:protein FMN transferase [Rhodoglobus sp.]